MKKKILVIFLVLIVILVSIKVIVWGKRKYELRQRTSNIEMIKLAEKSVKVQVTPEFDFSYEYMQIGVLQHLDRPYTYDVIPQKLLDGLLFQGIHRPPIGTIIKIDLLKPAKIYFFFHSEVDGGYSDIFSNLDNWELSQEAPQYDILNGSHGLEMTMYELDAEAGIYSIPPTTKDRGCFNIVFQAIK
ncbi:MAG: hypothetical protein GQ534_11060 [Candidatus Delongbacteria bacterium]|nr:hypothetical protein [Candidatus Delongbacteria bacterium]